jgi:hypothetical protein
MPPSWSDPAARGKECVEGGLEQYSGRARERWEECVQAMFGEKVWDNWKSRRID